MRRFASTSPSSMRYPLSLICSSTRPSKKRRPSRNRPRSPVLYARWPRRSKKARAVRSGRPMYPGLTLGPAIMIPPRSFAGNSWQFWSTTRICVPGIARPTGKAEYFCRIESSIRIDVVATVASVGPYMFQTCARGKRPSSSAAVCGASVSPQNKNRRARGSIASVNFCSTRHIRAKDGVEIHVVTPEFASAR